MSGFLKYQHVERWNHPECEGLMDGYVHIFYKLDGTNASIWFQDDGDAGWRIAAGSRNRELSEENDNAGFCKWVWDQRDKFVPFFDENPTLRLYGEWLVPHSLKTYREDAWKRFYVFDVWDDEKGRLLSYDEYKPLLEEFNIDYIPPLAIIKNPTEEDLYRLLQNTGQFLVEDGKGMGEGFVAKNYDHFNKYGRQVWGKMISNEFKEVHHREMGAPLINGSELIEEKIVREFLTEEFIKKELNKIIVRDNALFFDKRMIPELLGRVWYEFVREETVLWVKKFKNPKVNFGLLQNLVIKQTKKVFGL